MTNNSGETRLYTQAEFDECGQTGERDGYEKAVQEIDRLTGGDGEYRYCLGRSSGRHCPDAEAMKARIIARFDGEAMVPADVAELVIAARIVAFEDQSPEALRQLDKASEAFADRVPWDNEPAALTEETGR